MRDRILLFLIGLACCAGIGHARENRTGEPATVAVRDSVYFGTAADSTVRSVIVTADSAGVPEVTMKTAFKPDPTKAVLYALVPGLGQIYNRKYWKLPIVYGGFVGCAYALTWNGQMYSDYSQAYLDLMDDDPNTDSYKDFVPPNVDVDSNRSQYETIFRRRKDLYRRYRDLSAFCFIGVYILSVIDAYVDAHLSEFDISRDLSMRIGPAVINSSNASRTSSSYGIGCHLNF